MEMGKANLRKINTNTGIYVKNPKGKNHTQRDFTIIMAITMVFLWCARVFGLNWSSPSRWKRSTIYISSVCWIRLQSSALFKHLTAYLRGG